MATLTGRRSMLEQVVAFSRALLNAGVEVNSGNLIDLVHSLRYVNLSNRSDFYAAARATLVSRYDDLEPFDEVFRRFWEAADHGFPEAPSLMDDPREETGVEGVLDGIESGDDGEGGSVAIEAQSTAASYSPDEVLMGKDLAGMSDREVDKARRIISEIVSIIANRRSRRRVPERRGPELDFRRTWRKNALYGRDGVALIPRRRRIKKTKLMVLCDVSGSMDCYSRFLIQFIYALKREIRDVEVAVFSTRLTVISRLLKSKGVEASLREVSENVRDWAGGTDIGGCLREFNDRFARDMLRSRTVMIIVSDGWDRGDADLMRQEMERLRRRAHKLIWLNPLLGSPGYRPLCLGMKTALPYLNYFLPAHNLESLVQLAKTLRSAWQR